MFKEEVVVDVFEVIEVDGLVVKKLEEEKSPNLQKRSSLHFSYLCYLKVNNNLTRLAVDRVKA